MPRYLQIAEFDGERVHPCPRPSVCGLLWLTEMEKEVELERPMRPSRRLRRRVARSIRIPLYLKRNVRGFGNGESQDSLL